jgi:hypothetical protein
MLAGKLFSAQPWFAAQQFAGQQPGNTHGLV